MPLTGAVAPPQVLAPPVFAPSHDTPTPDAGTPDPIAQIVQLHKLKQQGILTAGEFAAAKAKLLNISSCGTQGVGSPGGSDTESMDGYSSDATHGTNSPL